MKSENIFIRIDEIQVLCNIQVGQIKSLSIKERMASHTVVEVVAEIEAGSISIAGQEFNGQPLVIVAVKDGERKVLFSGVIGEICIDRESIYETIFIKAQSLSWLMDMEKKNKSYQGDTSILELIQKIGKDNSFSLICSVQDKKTEAPFIQYKETDWEFLVRLSTHLKVPLYVAGGYEGKGLCLGLQTQEAIEELTPLCEKWCMDVERVRKVNFDMKKAVYYEMMGGQILHVGQCVRYNNKILWPFAVDMVLWNGMLHCTSQLGTNDYYIVPTRYNRHIKGAALKAKVLKRQNETIRVHMDIDIEQDVNNAYDYPWFPEHGNMVYCMPEEGSEIQLWIAGEDERRAVGIDCVRQGGGNSGEAQIPANRWFTTDHHKKLILQPSVMELSGEEGQSKISFNDSSGDSIMTLGNMLIQAKGKVVVQGNKVNMAAPKEITAIKRELGEPAVVNICHNLDAMGKQTTFNNLEELKINSVSGKGRNHNVQQQLSQEARETEKEKRKKLQFEMQKLLAQEKEKSSFELGNSIINIISAIPQCAEQDRISQIAMGFRPITGRMKGE
ncbi:MAG: phage late control D family protein [Lachnospiraceae bacterium]|nr:phage late control D family protein [Lachnospiraceae bacterium]